MDKAEYQNRLDELKAGIDAGDYEKAREIADGIDWRRVKSVRTLCMVADVYEKTRSYPKAKEILQIAQARSSIGRGVLSRLVEICLKLGQTDEAEAYFRDYSKVAQGDNSRLVLQYQIYRAKGAPLDAQITVLEEYREKEYTEEWAYELAERYAEAGDQEKCVETCDDLILWFSEGKYVLKALELKKQFEPLTEKQMALYIQERDAENERARQAALAKARAEAEKKASAEAAERERQQAALREQEALAAEEESGNEAEDETVPAVTEDEAGAAAPDAVPYPAETESVPDQAEPEYGSDLLRQDGGVYPAAPENEEEGRLNGNLSSKTGGDALDGLDIPGFVNVIPLKQENRETEPEVPADQAEPVYAGEGYDDEPEEIREKAPAEEGLKGRLLKSFHNMFGDDRRRRNAEDESEDEEFPKKDERKKKDIHLFRKKDPREADQFEPAVKEPAVEEPEERNLRLRDLAPEAAMLGGAAASVAAGATGELPVEDVRPLSEKKQQVAFDLDSFLNETAGSFSNEIESGGYRGTTEEEPMRLDEDINTPEEEAFRNAEKIRQENAKMPLGATAAGILAGLDEPKPERKKPKYNEELEIPDEEPTAEERKAHTIPLNMLGQNTVPISIDKILSQETPEEQRIRILNKARPTRMNEEQRRIFTYFARIPGMDSQILEAISCVYAHAGERTSLHGNIGVMGARGTGKTRLSQGLVTTMCRDMGLKAAKIARITGEELNKKDPSRIVSIMAGGFLMIEDISRVSEATLNKLNQAMEFRTDCMIVIIEDDKSEMRTFLKNHPIFAAKFDKLISIPIFTNDELVTFARTYADENGCKMDDLGILALYTKIGSRQSPEKPVTISVVRDMVDAAIDHALKGRKRSKRNKDVGKMLILHEKDFE